MKRSRWVLFKNIYFCWAAMSMNKVTAWWIFWLNSQPTERKGLSWPANLRMIPENSSQISADPGPHGYKNRQIRISVIWARSDTPQRIGSVPDTYPIQVTIEIRLRNKFGRPSGPRTNFLIDWPFPEENRQIHYRKSADPKIPKKWKIGENQIFRFGSKLLPWCL